MLERQGLTTEKDIQFMRRELELISSNYGKAHQKKITIKRRVKRIIFVTMFSVMILMLVNIIKINVSGGVPTIFGYYLFRVESASMSPTLQVGDAILSRKLENPRDISVGSIVTFENEDGLRVTHRVVDVVENSNGVYGYITKGDNTINSKDSSILLPERVIAEFVTKVPYL